MKAAGIISEDRRERENLALALLHEFKRRGTSCGVLREHKGGSGAAAQSADLLLAQTEAELSPSGNLQLRLSGIQAPQFRLRRLRLRELR